jgi:hypothetical protein
VQRRKIVSENGTEEEDQTNPPETTATGSDDGSDDAPELGISVGVEEGNVIILFSQRLTTVGMPPEAAEKMANALLEHAATAREVRKEAESPIIT